MKKDHILLVNIYALTIAQVVAFRDDLLEYDNQIVRGTSHMDFLKWRLCQRKLQDCNARIKYLESKSKTSPHPQINHT